MLGLALSVDAAVPGKWISHQKQDRDARRARQGSGGPRGGRVGGAAAGSEGEVPEGPASRACAVRARVPARCRAVGALTGPREGRFAAPPAVSAPACPVGAASVRRRGLGAPLSLPRAGGRGAVVPLTSA